MKYVPCPNCDATGRVPGRRRYLVMMRFASALGGGFGWWYDDEADAIAKAESVADDGHVSDDEVAVTVTECMYFVCSGPGDTVCSTCGENLLQRRKTVPVGYKPHHVTEWAADRYARSGYTPPPPDPGPREVVSLVVPRRVAMTSEGQ